MGKTITKEQFIEKAKEIHGDKYDYSLTNYNNKTTKVKIICKEHGIFEQIPYSHLKGHKCKKCSIDIGKLKTVSNIDEFIEKAIAVHGDLYDYNNSKYVNTSTNIEIRCKIHGVFEQTPNNHLQNKGCSLCGISNAKILRSKTNEEFIKEASKTHNNFYSYEKTKYINWNEFIIITCPNHGDFKQKAGVHLNKSGCTKCIQEKDFRKRSHYITLSEKSSIYLVRLYNKEEEFYKIGKTIKSVKNRFSGKKMPYNVEVIYEYEDDIEKVYDLEIKLHKKHKQFQYFPKIKFKGYTECYSLNLPIEEIINLKEKCQNL